jgi:hypothetical protein
MGCREGADIADASVIVQLYASALPIAVAAFDRDTAAKAKRRAAANDKRNLAGLDPLPVDTPTAEEASWRGGPGFCVQLANLTLDAMLADEQFQGFAYTAAVVGDGSWDPRAQRIARAALLHDGTRLGGALATDDLIGGFAEQAKKAGKANDAAHFQASVVQLTDSALRVWGAESFAGSVLAAVGVDRPAAQRFTDKPYIEIPLSDADSLDLSAADGDIVYMSFASPAAKDRAATLLDSAAWRTLSANRDNRVFVVNNEIWQTGQGLIAARGIVDDLRWLNSPIN